MEFVRTGWTNPANQRHPAVQRVEYWWRDGRIERVGYLAVDGAQAQEPQVLFDHVTDLQVQYRAAKGDWLKDWAPSNPDLLPVAVELIVTRKSEPPLTLRFLVGPAVGQNSDQAAPGADDGPAGGLSDGV